MRVGRRRGGEGKSGTRPLHLGGTRGETEAGLRNMKRAARRKRDNLSSSKRKAARARLPSTLNCFSLPN